MNWFKTLFKNDQVSESDIKEQTQLEELEIKDELRRIVTKRWEGQLRRDVPFEEIYDQLIEEGALIVKTAWKEDAKYSPKTKYRVDEVVLNAYDVITITEELGLYSRSSYSVINPKTEKSCFFSPIWFPSQDIADKYISDILSVLPDETECSQWKGKNDLGKEATKYSFTIKLTDLES